LIILLLTSEYPNREEPVRSVFNREIAINLKKYAEVKVVAPVIWLPRFLGHKNNRIPAYENIDGIDVYHPRYLFFPKVGRFLHGLLYYVSIRSQFEKMKYKFDFIYSIWAYPDGFAAVLLAKYYKRSVAINVIGCDINLYTRYPFRRMMIKYALKNCDRVFSVSEDLREKVVNLGVRPEKVQTVHNGVDKGKFFPMATDECRKRLSLATDKKIVTFIGRLSEEKGIESLTGVMEQLGKQRGDEVIFIVIGSGPLKEYIKKKADGFKRRPEVLMPGSVGHKDIPLWINASTIICVPSLREGCPNVVLEALACGKPVVASNVGGIPEIINSPQLGFLVPPNNVDELIKALGQALDTEWDRNILECRVAGLTWEKVAGNIYSDIQAIT
jgi:glycosyltransferase involved in cell wall biosynthesis